MWKLKVTGIILLIAALAGTAGAVGNLFPGVPGVVIDHDSAASGIYIGSPTLVVLDDRTYIAAHDEFGPKSAYNTAAITRVFRSVDKGKSWAQIAMIHGALWSTLFTHDRNLYLIGVTHEYSNLVIRRSTDGGVTWTDPKDAETGLLAKGKYHTAPVPVVVHDGRIWRCLEDAGGPGGWGHCFRAMAISAPANADLLKAGSWTLSNYVSRDATWLNGKFGGWLEGNAVITPDGKLVDILRVDARPDWSIGAIVQISADGKRASFDPHTGFIKLPGADKKFTIRHDPISNLYWSLTNDILPQDSKTVNSERTRNTLSLVRSSDLVNWTTRCILLHHNDWNTHAFQYVDWLIDGNDIIAVSRTAFDDGQGGANSGHNANFMTFHRFTDFRNLTMKDSVVAVSAQ
jgi:hypothetical protein